MEKRTNTLFSYCVPDLMIAISLLGKINSLSQKVTLPQTAVKAGYQKTLEH